MLIPSQLSPKYPSAHLLHSGNPVKPSAHLSHLIPITLEDLQEHFPFKSQVWSTDPSTLHPHANNYNTNPTIYDSIFLLFSVLDKISYILEVLTLTVWKFVVTFFTFCTKISYNIIFAVCTFSCFTITLFWFGTNTRTHTFYQLFEIF